MSAKAILTKFSLACVILLAGCSDGDGTGRWVVVSKALDSFVGVGPDQVGGYSFALAVNGKTVFTRAGGLFPTDAAVPIASASKAPSATIILSLVKDGLIDLDTPVSEYLGNLVYWPLDKRAITMRMLLNHTSGIPFTSSCLDEDNTSLRACTQEIANSRLDFAPGTAFGYSGAGYQVAGFVAQQVSGKSWTTLVQERLTEPLGMSSFNYGDPRNPRIAGGAVSNAEDYLKFTQLYLDGGRVGDTEVITPGQVQTAKTSQIAGLPVFYTPIPDGSGIRGYSFGWWISDNAIHPGSAGPELSDPGVLGTTPWLDFGQSYTAIVLISGGAEKGLAIWNAARPEILQELNGR